MTQDRRSGAERRSTVRYPTNILIQWKNRQGCRAGTICDLSETGCFVLSSGAVEDGENVQLIFTLNDESEIALPGIIINHVDEIGFAARFTEFNDEAQLFLKYQLQHLSQTSTPHNRR